MVSLLNRRAPARSESAPAGGITNEREAEATNVVLTKQLDALGRLQGEQAGIAAERQAALADAALGMMVDGDTLKRLDIQRAALQQAESDSEAVIAELRGRIARWRGGQSERTRAADLAELQRLSAEGLAAEVAFLEAAATMAAAADRLATLHSAWFPLSYHVPNHGQRPVHRPPTIPPSYLKKPAALIAVPFTQWLAELQATRGFAQE